MKTEFKIKCDELKGVNEALQNSQAELDELDEVRAIQVSQLQTENDELKKINSENAAKMIMDSISHAKSIREIVERKEMINELRKELDVMDDFRAEETYRLQSIINDMQKSYANSHNGAIEIVQLNNEIVNLKLEIVRLQKNEESKTLLHRAEEDIKGYKAIIERLKEELDVMDETKANEIFKLQCQLDEMLKGTDEVIGLNRQQTMLKLAGIGKTGSLNLKGTQKSKDVKLINELREQLKFAQDTIRGLEEEIDRLDESKAGEIYKLQCQLDELTVSATSKTGQTRQQTMLKIAGIYQESIKSTVICTPVHVHKEEEEYEETKMEEKTSMNKEKISSVSSSGSDGDSVSVIERLTREIAKV